MKTNYFFLLFFLLILMGCTIRKTTRPPFQNEAFLF